MKFFLFISLCILPILAPIARGQANGWTSRTSPSMGGRGGAYVFEINGVVYVGGGDDARRTNNDLWAYDLQADTWRRRADLPGSARAAAAVFVVGSRAYVVGGERQDSTGGPTDLNDAWAYDAPTDRWLACAPLPAPGRIGAYGFALNGIGYVGGGAAFASPSNLGTFSDFWAYQPATDTWAVRATLPTMSTMLGGSFALGGAGYIAGGAEITPTFQTIVSSQVWSYAPATNQWSRRADMPTPRAYVSGFAMGPNGYLAEGISDVLTPTPEHDLLRYDPVADAWAVLPVPGATGRLVPVAFGLGGALYLGGGISPTANTPLADFWRLTGQPTGTPALAPAPAFTLVPNPATSLVRLTGAPTGPVQLLDAVGRVVRAFEPRAADFELPLEGLPPGLYTVRVGAVARRLVVK